MNLYLSLYALMPCYYVFITSLLFKFMGNACVHEIFLKTKINLEYNIAVKSFNKMATENSNQM